MNDLISLAFANARVRMVVSEGVPWWAGVDVVGVLEIAKPYQALGGLEDYQRRKFVVDTPGGPQEIVFINESGVYSLIFRSRKPVAKMFMRWLTCEVLPSIRRYGFYASPALLAAVQQTMNSTEEVPLRQGQRFAIERTAFETRERMTLLKATEHLGVLSKPRLKAIEAYDAAIGEKLYVVLDALKFDMHFIRFGERRLKPSEAALVDAYRLADHDQRLTLLMLAGLQRPGVVAGVAASRS